MQSLRIIILTAVLLISFTGQAQDKGMLFEKSDWAGVLAKAKKEKKYIFLDAYASWCGPCKWMSKEIFPQEKVGEFMNARFVHAKIDMEKGEGIALAQQYQVGSYPTYLFFNPDGELVHRGLGSMPAEDFIALCSNALDSSKQYMTLRKQYLGGQRDSAFLRQFTYVASDAQDTLTQEILKAYLITQHQALNETTIPLIHYVTGSIEDPGFSLMVQYPEKFEAVLGKETYASTMEGLVWYAARKAGKKGSDTAAFRKVIQHYLPEQTDLLCAQYQLSLLKRSENWKDYLPKALAFADKFCQEDWQRLNDIAATLSEQYTTKDTHEKALKMALRSVDLHPVYDNYDTAAQLYFQLNDLTNAKVFAEKAIAAGKAAGTTTTATESLLQKIISAK